MSKGRVQAPDGIEKSGKPVLVRWVTWWPTPYWADRFNYLVARDDVGFEAVFLSGQSSILNVEVDRAAYKFRYVFLSQRRDSAGYYSDFKVRIPRPWPLVRGRFDALIMPYSEASCIVAAVLCRVLREPYFLFAANTKHDKRKASRFRQWLKRSLFENATGILATGPLQRDYAAQYVTDKEKISTIGNPVGTLGAERYHSPVIRDELRNEFGWEGETVLLYVGRFGPEKGLSTLIGALSKVPLKARLRLVLVGSGPSEAELRSRVSDLGIKTQFTGFLQREELARRYAAADVFVLPSHSEPWGLVVNEAMEFGLPLILSDKVGCVPALLREGQNGLAFAAGDSEALAVCVERLSSNEGLRRRMGLASREIIRDHSLERWADTVLCAIRKSANRGRDLTHA